MATKAACSRFLTVGVVLGLLVGAGAGGCKEAARDGGVIIGAHSIGSDVPPANYDYYQSLIAEPI